MRPLAGSSPSRRVLARLAALAVAGAVLVWLAHVDTVAAAAVALGVVVILALLRGRSASRARLAIVGFVVGATAIAVTAAVALPAYHAAAPPLLVLGGSQPHIATATLAHPTGVWPTAEAAALRTPQTNFEALGYVASDIEDSGPGVDRDAASLTTLAATGIELSSKPGGIEVSPVEDTLIRAHLNQAAGVAVVSNYDGNDFNGARAEAMLQSAGARRHFVAAVVAEVKRHGWDGVSLDMESLPASVRTTYATLVSELKAALGSRSLSVAVPAPGDASTPDLGAYDLAALGRRADRIVLMAYDQHDPTGVPGPVAGLPWVRQRLSIAEQAIPRGKLLLGIAGYGYSWDASGQGQDMTYPQAHAVATASGAQAVWDDVQQEWHVHTADGTDVWYEDARSAAVRAEMAYADGLAGIALWRVGSEDPATLSQLPVPAAKHLGRTVGRPVRDVNATGLVALTFDDGPDPTWTPRILAVLRREHVPGTFFVIGTAAQAHPSLLRAELAGGNVIANHTYSHPSLTTATPWRTKVEILGDGAVIEGITGRKPVMFRSPYGGGDMSTTRLGSDQLAANLGLHNVSWNVDSNDWLRPGRSAIVRTVVGGATSRTTVLLHDGGGNRSQTLAALPAIIDQLRARGYQFTTADALDGSISSPYAIRRGVLARGRGIAIVAGYRLVSAARRVGLWLLAAVIGASLLRIIASGALAALHRRRTRTPLPPVAVRPSVSIVIPAHNEEAVIGKTLEALTQLRGAPFQVIVVDDGSTDATARVATAAGVTVLRQPRSGKATALNAGLAEADGDVVVVLDADTVLDRGFLDAVLPHFADPRVGAVAGNVKVGNRTGLLGNLQALEYLTSLNLDRRAQATLNVVAVVPGAAGAFRRAAVMRAGGYPTDTLVEDMDLTVTLLRAGWRIPYEPAALARTEAPERVRDVLRQRRRWAFGTLQVAAKHARAVLDPDAGRVGLIGLPWMVLSQVVLPLAGPLIDLYLLWLLVSGRWPTALLVMGVGAAIDLAVVGMAVWMEHEDPFFLLLTPMVRLVWRPLQLAAVVLSVHRWVHGATESWRKVRRYNTVPFAVLAKPSAA